MNRLLPLVLLAAGLAQAETATYTIDPTHTFVHFEVLHFGISTLRGRFDRKDGAVTIDRAAGTGRAEITIDTTSVSTGVAALDARLRGADFLDAGRFPTARFVGEAFRFDGDKLAAVDGSLTLLGRTRPVTLQASRFDCYDNLLLRREVCGGDFEATIRRSDWGSTALAAEGMVADPVRLLVQIEGIRQ